MERLIDAESAFSFADELKVKETGAFSKGYNKAINDMKSAFRNDDAIQTVDAQPVVHGEWTICEDDWNDETIYTCSVCKEDFVTIDGTPAQNLWNYCPNCGAKMDLEGSE